MSIRYTLRLTERGAEVWKRWTGDREEALRDLAQEIVHLNPDRAEAVMMQAVALHPDTVGPGDQRGFSIFSNNLTVELSFEVRRTSNRVQ